MDAALQQLVWTRAGQRCEYCQVPADVALLPFQIDHIVAEKHGGLASAENLALSCERSTPTKDRISRAILKVITSHYSTLGKIDG